MLVLVSKVCAVLQLISNKEYLWNCGIQLDWASYTLRYGWA